MRESSRLKHRTCNRPWFPYYTWTGREVGKLRGLQVQKGSVLPKLEAADLGRVQNIAQVSHILDACCRLTGMGFCAIARVTDDTWLTCAALDKVQFGLRPGDELPLNSTICAEIRQHRHIVAFDDASADPKYCTHHSPGLYGLKSYISVPIILEDGTFFGTLCAVDAEPRQVNTPEVIGIFTVFADLIASNLSQQVAFDATERALAAERETARLREEFIAVVGHDLRNPVTALSAGLRLLERNTAQPELVTREMRKSIVRINSIISNLMDLARGRLGGGIAAVMQTATPLNEVIQDVVNEISLAADQEIILNTSVHQPLAFDPQRIGQLLSNLLGNAVTHGVAKTAILLEAHVVADVLTISITNKGDPIPQDVLDGMFQPFTRGATPGAAGLGLGLYISSEIARGHGGALVARSEAGNITFTFTMPVLAG